jgi:hypothetical protein
MTQGVDPASKKSTPDLRARRKVKLKDGKEVEVRTASPDSRSTSTRT